MRLLAFALLPFAAVAQSVVEPAQIPRAMSRIEARPDDRPLACTVTPFGPALNFSFRIQAGYTVRIPMNQFQGPRHAWFTVIRVTPSAGGRKPVYLASRTRLPEVPKNKAEVEVGGGFLLGEGAYDVRWMMMDDQGRVCRKEWRLQAKLSRGERHASVAMRPNTVTAFSLLGSTDQQRAHDDTAPFRVTILMHAAPLLPRRTHFRVTDGMLLMGSLGALLERLPVRSIRLVVFNLDQQKELYRKDEFSLPSLDEVWQSMSRLELDAVDYQVLQKPKGHIDLLTDLVNREARAATPPDAVLFLGPSARYEDKPSRDALSQAGTLPKFFYFQYRPFLRRLVPAMPDTISLTVSDLKGKTMIIHSPAEFAKAIDQLERLAPNAAGARP
jgi:hypothetical protein